jgi:hypothetical protein
VIGWHEDFEDGLDECPDDFEALGSGRGAGGLGKILRWDCNRVRPRNGHSPTIASPVLDTGRRRNGARQALTQLPPSIPSSDDLADHAETVGISSQV